MPGGRPNWYFFYPVFIFLEPNVRKEFVSDRLSGTRINNIVVLKGIGNNLVITTMHI